MYIRVKGEAAVESQIGGWGGVGEWQTEASINREYLCVR